MALPLRFNPHADAGSEPPTGSEASLLDVLGVPLEPELALDLLHDVIDPELGVNIVDLGLVYDVLIDGGGVRVVMTLTTPGCPLGGYIEDEIRSVLGQLPQVREIAVEIVWDPPWGPEQMSDAAREQLGWCC